MTVPEPGVVVLLLLLVVMLLGIVEWHLPSMTVIQPGTFGTVPLLTGRDPFPVGTIGVLPFPLSDPLVRL